MDSGCGKSSFWGGEWEKETYGTIEEMLETLGDDGHTRFLTPEKREQNDQSLSETYIKIRIQLEEENDEIIVAAPIEDSPAEETGISSDDVIVAIDRKSVRDADVSEVVEKVKEPEKTSVELIVHHEENKRMYDLQRTEIDSPVASWILVPGTDVALMLLSSFSDDSTQQLQNAFEKAKTTNTRRFILNLRNNPGDKLDQTIKMTKYFLEPESVVYVHKNTSDEHEKITIENNPKSTNASLTILINENSTSNTKILTKTLQNNTHTPIIKKTTFDTDTILSKFILKNKSSILLSVAE